MLKEAQSVSLSTAETRAWVERLGKGRQEAEQAVIRQACELAGKAHHQQIRASGEPYILHSLAVAEILHHLHLDHETLAAAILHDVLEDTDVTVADIETAFGPAIAHLVDGVTKMDRIDEFQSVGLSGWREHEQAESLRKMLLAMAEDVRVVLIKLADRVHNMRTLKHLDRKRQQRIAKETLDIYAPLANRLGIWQIKWELEDLSLRYLESETYAEIARLLDEKRIDREDYIRQVVGRLEKELKAAKVEGVVSGRPKHIYSIWRKMQKKNLDFHQIFDVRAVRVLVPEIKDCYAALGVVHGMWRHIPNEFDDYIANPKKNLYRSLHTAVIGPEGKTLEIQIRTRDMHRHAELGVAAHWRYKEGGRFDPGFEEKISWMRQLLEWKEEESSARDFVDRFKSEAFHERVYVLTPRGDVLDLPIGASVLDFAYYVHSDIGNRCRGGKIDGNIVPLTHVLKNGDQVEILTTRQGSPSRDWLNPHLGYLNTPRARAKVRSWFRHQDHDKNVSAGRASLERELHRLGISGLSHEHLSERLNQQGSENLYAAIGRGEINTGQLAAAAHYLASPNKEIEVEMPVTTRRRKVSTPGEFSIHGVGNLLTNMAHCCRPVPRDPIIGYITRGRGVTIHRRDCSNILRLKNGDRERLIDVEWGGHVDRTYPVDIHIVAYDRTGLLRDITALLSNEKINVLAVNTTSDKSDGKASMDLTLEITDISQLSRVLSRLSEVPNVAEVQRRQ